MEVMGWQTEECQGWLEAWVPRIQNFVYDQYFALFSFFDGTSRNATGSKLNSEPSRASSCP